MLEHSELNQLNKAWPIALIIWSAMLFSLGIYVGIPHLTESLQVPNQINITFSQDFTFATLKYILFGVSFMALFAAYYVRKSMMMVPNEKNNATAIPQHQYRHPAFGKYSGAILIPLMLSESAGICGLVLFLLNKDWLSLYFLNVISAIAMFHFRPKRQELLDLATKMNRQTVT